MKQSFLLLMFLLSCISFGQSSNKLIWEENRKLSWEDFQGKPSAEIPFHANTNSGIAYSWGMKGSANRLELTYTVETFFYKDQSWVRPDFKNNFLLKHEQLHFDISELYARKLRVLLSQVDGSKLNKDSGKQLSKLYETIAAERGAMQEQFDKETNHSSNKEADLIWQLKIEEELKKLAAFGN